MFSHSFIAMQGDSERYVYPRGNSTIYKTNTEKSYLNTYMISFVLFRIWDPPINPISSARTSKQQISQAYKPSTSVVASTLILHQGY